MIIKGLSQNDVVISVIVSTGTQTAKFKFPINLIFITRMEFYTPKAFSALYFHWYASLVIGT